MKISGQQTYSTASSIYLVFDYLVENYLYFEEGKMENPAHVGLRTDIIQNVDGKSIPSLVDSLLGYYKSTGGIWLYDTRTKRGILHPKLNLG